MRDTIRKAFWQVAQGHSIDRLIADPGLNREFLNACKDLGLSNSPVELNQQLLNLRKRGDLKPSGKTIRTRVENTEEYRFASEIAARHLEQRHKTTLDRILCDPQLAAEFDTVAGQLAAGFTPLEYRWAALQLRKTSKLKPELVLRVANIKAADFGPIEKVRVERIPNTQGIYIFYSNKETLYLGEAENLRKRVGKHLDHSDRKALAHWLWEHGSADVRLETIELPDKFTQYFPVQLNHLKRGKVLSHREVGRQRYGRSIPTFV